IGEYALDLEAFASANGFSALSTIQPHQAVFSENTLNAFAALGQPIHAAVRKYLQSVFLDPTPFPDALRDNASLRASALVPLKEVTCHLPMRIGDYTDFYAGLNHAHNVGSMFRGPAHALQPNYKHLPVGYHGRASSVVVSGTPIRRPWGQFLPDPAAEPKSPTFAPCRKLDIELELGAFVCAANAMGEPVGVARARQSIFGLVLLNDWSARDIQAWEYVPLGPFNAKNFGTTVSPWVVLVDALEPFLARGLRNDTELLPYLRGPDKGVYDIRLEVALKPSSSSTPHPLTATRGTNLLFSFAQMLAHHTSTGCNMNVGDLLGSGTISGPTPQETGSLLERTMNGKVPVKLGEGEGAVQRGFLEDGDEVVISGVCATTMNPSKTPSSTPFTHP
ncbi:hypothetical protein LTR66_016487, partial [Elasticomyces elasticus]